MKVLETIAKLIAKLPAELWPLLLGLIRDLRKSPDPKAVLTRSREIAAKKLAFVEAQRAKRRK